MTSIRHLFLATTALIACGHLVAAQGRSTAIQARAEANSATPISMNIPAQPLEKALQAFAAQSGLQVIFPTELTQELTSPALEGSYTPEAALTRLLANSNLRYIYANPRTIAIQSLSSDAQISNSHESRPTSQATGQASSSEAADGAPGRSQDFWNRFRLAQAQQGPPAATPSKATGAQDGGEQLEEIVVTSQKRVENIQTVPISVTAISADTLNQQHLFDPTQLPMVAPSLTYQTANNQIGGLYFSIRGMGTQISGPSAEQSVATVVDDVTMARPQFSNIQFYDLSRIEVLNGPQGMLFGKNASAGLINIVTARPVIGTFDAMTRVSYGITDDASSGREMIGQGVVNVPTSDNSALRISAFMTHQDGFEKDIYNDEFLGLNEGGMRIKYLLKPNSSWEIYLAADYAEENGPSNSVITDRFAAPGGVLQQQDALAGITASPNNIYQASNSPNSNYFKVGGGQANVTYFLPNDLSITDIAAVRSYHDRTNLDADLLPIPFFDADEQGRDELQISNELRLTSPSESRFQYQAGLYYLHLRYNFFVHFAELYEPLFPPPPPGLYNAGGDKDEVSHTDSAAVFGQAQYSIIEGLRIIGGARFTDDSISQSQVFSDPNILLSPFYPPGPSSGSVNRKNFSFRTGMEYDIAPDVMSYVTFTRGYKGPMFNDQPLRLVNPEIPIDVEAGVKSTFFDRRLTFNIDVYHEDLHGFQSQAYIPGNSTLGVVILNAGNLRAQGVETDFRAIPLKGLTLSGAADFNDAKYQSFQGNPCYYGEPTGTSGTNVCLPDGTSDSSGNRLAFAPRFTATLAANYERPVTSRFNGYIEGNYYYRGNLNFSANGDPQTRVGGYSMIGGSAGVETDDSRWRVSVFVRNLTNKRIPSFIEANPLTGSFGDGAKGGDYWQQFDVNSFRTVGASLDWRW
jgi:iron complex outermembrane recepter protein